jgi:peptide chain release factor 3
VIGVINSSSLAIGDTLSLTGDFTFKPLPQFQPEIFAKLHPKDVGKRKAFDKGVLQLIAEGAIQMLKRPGDERELIFAAVGQLQFEVMQYRLKDEYGVETILTPLPYQSSAWIQGDLATFVPSPSALVVEDRQGRPMALFTSPWDKQYAIRQNPKHQLIDVAV